MYSPHLLVLLLGFLSAIVLQAEAYLLSDETVEVYLDQNAIVCYDEVRDGGGFVDYMPGGLSISQDAIFDRTLRVSDLWLHYTLPSDVNCAAIKEQIAAVPRRLWANRKVYRSFHAFGQQQRSTLDAFVTLEIPVVINGVNAVLSGNAEWREKNPFHHDVLPEITTYNARIHPQSASNGVGLFCNPRYSLSDEYELSFGRVSAYGVYANLDVLTRTFKSQEACEEARNDLLQRYQAQDPENWGSIIRVTRKLESVYRYILANDATGVCQEIMLESLSTNLDSYRFTGVLASFPLRTVDISNCKQMFVMH